MISIALRHKQKVLSARAESVGDEKSSSDRTLKKRRSPVSTKKHRQKEQVVLDTLEADLNRLKGLDSVADKIDLKRQDLVKKYLAVANDYREAGERLINDVVAYLIIWLVDIEDIEAAIDWAEYALENKVSMPERFKRDLPTYVAEEICTWSEAQYAINQSASPYLDHVVARVESKQWHVKNFVVKTKLFKLTALYAERDKDWHKAVLYFEKCVEVNPKGHGVKTKLKNALKQLQSSPMQPDYLAMDQSGSVA